MKVDKSIIYALIEAAMSANYTGGRRIGGQIAKGLAEQNDLEGAKELQALLRKRGVPLQASGYASLYRWAGNGLPIYPKEDISVTKSDGIREDLAVSVSPEDGLEGLA